MSASDSLNYAITNRIPRALVSRAVARISRSEHPVIRTASMKVWTFFGGDLALHEAKHSHFRSVHACFTRELKDGARPVDPDPTMLVSPCDAIVGAHGEVTGTRAFQAKGRPYQLEDLLIDPDLVARHRNGHYVTLRLTSTMYHRFHAPGDCRVDEVMYVPGDTWNVNPAALARIDRVFCRNERAVVPIQLTGIRAAVTLVPVAAILVGSLRLNFTEVPLDRSYSGPLRLSCRADFSRGQEMGYFEHGSTILVFAGAGLALADGLAEGKIIRMGQPLLRQV